MLRGGGKDIDGNLVFADVAVNADEMRQLPLAVHDGRNRKRRVEQGEVMRRGLGCDAKAIGFCGPHEIHTARRGQMQKVNRRAGEPRQLNITKDHQFFGYRWPSGHAQTRTAPTFMHHRTLGKAADFAVLGQHDVETLRVFEGPTHEQRILNPVAVVGENPNAGRGQLGHRRQHLAFATHGDAAAGKHFAQTSLDSEAANKVDHSDAVVWRLGVWHSDNGGETATGRCSRARFHRFCLLAPGLAKMHVQVNKTRTDHAVGSVELVVTVQIGTNLGDSAVLHQYIGPLLATLVEHSTALDDNRPAH